MSKLEKIAARARRCQLRALRGQLAAGMRDLHRLQRASSRSHRQRQMSKEARALRSLVEELRAMETRRGQSV